MASEQKVPVPQGSLWVHDSGGTGQPVVLCHPGIADHTIWDRLLPLLEDVRVVRWDMRGFGGSPISEGPFRTVDDLAAVLDAIGAERVHLVGNSMGGEASLALAVSQPDRVATMTLLSPGVGGYPWPEPSAEDQALIAEWTVLNEAGDVDGLVRMQLAEWCRDGVDDYLTGQMAASTRADLAHGDLAQDNPEQWQALPSLSVPTCVIACRNDPPDGYRATLDLAARIPGVELVEIDADHVPQYRDPGTVAAAIRRTLART